MAEKPGWWTFVTRAGEAWWVITLTLVAALARLPVFFRTFASGDEATYSALASAMLDGQWLYVGAVDHKPPLIAATYALVFGAGGRDGIHIVHAASILIVVATALVLGALARRLGLGRPAARAGAAIYVVWSATGPGKDMLAANGELLMALPAVAALALAWPAGIAGSGGARGVDAIRSAAGEMWRWVAAGALTVVAALFKYQGAAVAAPLALLAFAGWGSDAGGRRAPGASHPPGDGASRVAPALGWRRGGLPLARLGCAALGGSVVLAALVGLYWRQGQIDALAFWAWTYPLRYAGSLDLASAALNAATMSGLWLLVSAGPLAAAAAGWSRADRFRNGASKAGAGAAAARAADDTGGEPLEAGAARAWLVVWVASAALGVASGGRFFLHYYLQLLPPIALLAGVGLERLVGSDSAGARRWFVAAGSLTAGLLAVTWALNAADFRLHRDRARHDVVYQEVGAFIRSHSDPTETVLVWGNSPEIYYYARRSMGTRFPFCNYHSGKIWGTPSDRPGAEVDSAQVLEPAWDMLLADLAARRPTLVVDAASAGLDRWQGHEIARYPRLAALVNADYRPIAVVDRVVIYQRRDTLSVVVPGEERGAPR